jgi:two-component sensor histidine kinase
MAIKHLSYRTNTLRDAILTAPDHHAAGRSQLGAKAVRCAEIRLREAPAREERLLAQKDALIQQHELLHEEADHRLLNGLQMVVSLLSLQSRAAANAEAAAQLSIAADRVRAIARVHRRLHELDGVNSVAFKPYLEDLCRDFSTMLSSHERPHKIVVEAAEINLPTDTGIPLGFIVRELMTNAAKYGSGRITVRLEPDPRRGYAMTVSNDGPALPDPFNPAACSGLGMKIIRSFVERIDGELRFGRGDDNEGARLTVLFSLISGDRDRSPVGARGA